jgi:ABC-2 type transport system permease protein
MSGRAKFLWSIRRELWEHRSVYIAPLAVAAVVLVGFLFHIQGIAEKLFAVTSLDIIRQRVAVVTPFSLVASVILFTSLAVALNYCLDALYSERRDRSILFWKSMPVSDLTTVLSKFAMAMAVIPLIAFAIAFATQLALFLLTCVMLVVKGIDVSTLTSRLPLVQMTIAMFYGLAVHMLWYAPIYGWLLLVSAWARKAPFLWAVLPVFALFMVEKIAFGTGYVAQLVQYRFMGAMREAFSANAMKEPITQLSQLDPARFFSSAGLWTGLAAAAVFLAAAVWSRRRREPI